MSAALQQVGEECLNTYKNRIESDQEFSVREQAEAELFAYIIAVAAGQAGNLGTYVKLMESPLIQSPAMILRALRETETMLEDDYAAECNFDETQLENLKKKLGRIVNKNRKFIAELHESPPLMLPSD